VDIKNIRKLFNLSQALFALILGVSVKTVRSWEQGLKRPSSVASRFMDEMAKNPGYWRERIRAMSVTTGGRVANS
jgi:putative transcriptional regulator